MADTNIKAIIDQAFMQSYGVNFDFLEEYSSLPKGNNYRGEAK